MKVVVAFSIAALIVPHIGHADVRELTSAQLRTAIADDRAIASYRLIEGVERYTGGTVVDVRVFDVGGDVTYRILVRNDQSGLDAILVEGNSGQVIMPSTNVAQQVSAFARERTRALSQSELLSTSSKDNGNIGDRKSVV